MVCDDLEIRVGQVDSGHEVLVREMRACVRACVRVRARARLPRVCRARQSDQNGLNSSPSPPSSSSSLSLSERERASRENECRDSKGENLTWSTTTHPPTETLTPPTHTHRRARTHKHAYTLLFHRVTPTRRENARIINRLHARAHVHTHTPASASRRRIRGCPGPQTRHCLAPGVCEGGREEEGVGRGEEGEEREGGGECVRACVRACTLVCASFAGPRVRAPCVRVRRWGAGKPCAILRVREACLVHQSSFRRASGQKSTPDTWFRSGLGIASRGYRLCRGAGASRITRRSWRLIMQNHAVV